MPVDFNVVWFIVGLVIGFFVGRAFEKVWHSQSRMMKKVVKKELFDKKNGGE